ncbi:MAG: DUF1570 domain-containing protein [Planctomycetota bacterium]|nr:DUF1570 domain-containing protein [Planctomycetota bacterium]MDA1212846.1 DUF1570 domain-containing protein [Planctomycetota bacterium]
MLCLFAITSNTSHAVEKWITVGHSGPFTLKSEYQDDEHAELLDELADLQLDLSATLKLKITKKPIQIYLFRHKRSYQNYLSQRVPEGTSRQALFVKGDRFSQVYAYAHWGYDTDIRHEGTHAVLHNALPYLPMWLDEGLAEYFEETALNRASNHPHLKAMRWSMRLGSSPSLSNLEKKSELSEFGASEYRESWGYVHFFLHGGDDARQVLVEYLAEIQANRPPGKMSRFATERIPQFDRRVADHLSSWK